MYNYALNNKPDNFTVNNVACIAVASGLTTSSCSAIRITLTGPGVNQSFTGLSNSSTSTIDNIYNTYGI